MSLKILETCEQEISSKIIDLPLAFCYCFMLQNLFAVPSLQKHIFQFTFIFLFWGYFLISLVVLLSLFMCSVIAHRFISFIFICFPFLFFFCILHFAASLHFSSLSLLNSFHCHLFSVLLFLFIVITFKIFIPLYCESLCMCLFSALLAFTISSCHVYRRN